ncbi:filamentous hemagglutinin N-terminal domain-containing protein [Salmonella enterica subsp. diarizonae]|uniref:two-partner secretion domain-containing protein n=1 Tax=Salmonella enterica TaxID=28901 RepID=UPI0009AF569C|nr:filamentous hemagglutinin N-terminal domain-containing protein [Salmonella enterica]EAW1826185.1 filamentous hemagglutinin N-terminal domain-containing protein [Salmonella enterica subsp. diarizonae]EDT6985000.1 filamentous hemagglutinin N-terminal domain-containing protein [Salmonella enterica subsp. arizonae]EAR0003353.1 filamentous hemagglutinin N-terminal domain-containing protein [Salmonella enterica]EAT2562744.1 filamentous hemagglutinin N-terminal domain-containing protein [Salmonella
MNKIYRLKFDKRRNELVVVSEIAAGTGKKKNTGHIADLCDVSTFRKLVGTLTPLAFLTGLIISLFPVVALANPDLPTGGQIVGGQGSISTSGNQMTIHQQTQNMATNWQSFDIGKNNTVQFVQPDSSSVALNRVTGASGSQIMGTLKANGQVFILNPNGVLFGKDARVNVAGLVASTKNINTADFMKGQYTLSGEGNPGGQVVNQGSLTTAKGGYIVLAADQVKNSGTITTPSGKTVLAVGKTVTLQLDNGGLTSVSVDGSVVNALVENQGLISAADGHVFLTAQGKDMLLNTVVNNSGTIEAKGLESRGGEIVLNGGDSGVVNQIGQLLADSHAGPGGKITVEGQNIHLAANSRTSATGKTGGGEVYVGGGWQGKDSHIRNASKVVMDKTATVDVSATDAGNGGTAVLWSDDYTNFRGAILAKGGALSGDGGRVETSSHRNLQASGDVDTSASAGKGGEWLLDPTDVVIVGDVGADADVTTADGGNEFIFSPNASGAKILNTSIEKQLNKGANVTVRTSGTDTLKQPGDIVVDANIHKTKGGDATLTLVADRGIMINGVAKSDKSIKSDTGKLNIKLLAGGSSKGAVFVGNQIDTHGGDFSIGAVTNDRGKARNDVAVKVKGFAVIKTGAGNFTIENVALVDGSRVPKNMAGYSTGYNDGDWPKWNFLDGINIWGHITSDNIIDLQSLDLIYMGNEAVLSGKSINIKSLGSYYDAPSIWLKGVTVNAAGGNVNIQATCGTCQGSGIQLTDKTSITATQNIILDGISRNDVNPFGVKVNNSTFNAKSLEVKGVSTRNGIVGTGFELTNLTLKGELAKPENVTLSSAGSAISVTNRLDRSIVTDSNRDEILTQWHPENMTYIDMGGNAIFDDGKQGWTPEYSSPSVSGGGWVFDNTMVNAGGDVRLQGVGFTNSTVTVNHGNLNIANTGPVLLNGSTVEVNDGTVDVHSSEAGISLNSVKKGDKVNKGSIAAKGDISLTANKGPVQVVGVSDSDRSTIESENGRVSVSAGGGDKAVKMVRADVRALNGKITVDGETEGKNSGVYLDNVNMVASTPGGVDIEGHSESGDGVQVAGNTSLTDATVVGESDSGTGANINGALTVSGASEIKGSSTSGTGLKIAEKVTVKEEDGKIPTFTGSSRDKEGVIISSGIDGGEVTGDSASGDGVVLVKGADVHKAVVKGSSTTGRGVYVADPDAVLVDATVEGHSEKGTGVQLNKASVSGGRLTATSVEGTGLRVEEGSSADNVVISAQTVTGKAIDGENKALTATGGTRISTVGEAGNTNISENAKPVPGGTPSGAVAEALGNKLSESISALQKTLDTKLADLDGLQQTMTTLQMQFDQAVRTGAIGQVDLKRLETAMNGLSDRLNTAAELKDAFGALKTDTGSLEERLKKSDVLSAEIQGLTLPAGGGISAVAAELGAAKALQSATVSLQASLAARTEENGKVRLRLDSLKQRLKEAQEKGTAGGAVLAEMQTQLEGLERQQRSYGESLVHFQQSLAMVSQDGSRPVTSRQESVGRLQTALSGVSGISDMQVSTLGEQLQQAMTGYAQVVVTAQGQGGVNAQTSWQNRDQQDGFRAGGEPLIPVRGYQTQPQSVDIHLCDSDRCRLITLDVGKPSQVAMAEVTESRPDGK